MSNTARTASTTVDTSGMFKVATYYTDSTGKIVSLTGGENHVEKYFKVTPAPEAAYKLVLTQEFIYKNYYAKTIYTSPDGLQFTQVTPVSGGGTDWDGNGISCNAGRYLMTSYNGVRISDDGMHTWTRTLTANGTFIPIVAYGNTLATVRIGYNQINYSTDNGTTWQLHSTAYPNAIGGMCAFGTTLVVATYDYVYDDNMGFGTYTPKLEYYDLTNISAAAYASYTYAYSTAPVDSQFMKLQTVGNRLHLQFMTTDPYSYTPINSVMYVDGLPTANGWTANTLITTDYAVQIDSYTATPSGWMWKDTGGYIYSSGTLPDISVNPNNYWMGYYYDPFDETFFALGVNYDSSPVNFVYRSSNASPTTWTEVTTAHNWAAGDFQNSYMGYRLK